ncbi:hypothetical protein AX774_g5192 [Zancudomyces culisetae]|uniref:BZIP domain-containing protein n=1 Tax=Zancudomyces culisetae TaxID=1213189 RepID=A0A1R1PK86_ZANCU|nr:hypothetical protein AX774_g5192 [Zancudomyces culisetae]|eukprot:OMH81357.1 hypothetical protein AX774_g5192 [Zancudomyces culisetae]
MNLQMQRSPFTRTQSQGAGTSSVIGQVGFGLAPNSDEAGIKPIIDPVVRTQMLRNVMSVPGLGEYPQGYMAMNGGFTNGLSAELLEVQDLVVKKLSQAELAASLANEALARRRKRNALSAARLRNRRRKNESDLSHECDQLKKQVDELEYELSIYKENEEADRLRKLELLNAGCPSGVKNELELLVGERDITYISGIKGQSAAGKIQAQRKWNKKEDVLRRF